jgi:K+-sensing histidine kinase KdpD
VSRFEPLARYAPTEGSTTRIGLGLFIARAIVVAHEGTITVSSTEARGTTFEVRLRVAPPARPHRHRDHAETTHARAADRAERCRAAWRFAASVLH